jgi:GNAT superfamily N-acetyltransferase
MIRTAAPRDLDAVTALLAAQFREHAIATPDAALRHAVAGVLGDAGGRGRILLAERDGRPVGVAALSYQWTLEHGGRGAWLEELYVVPEAREGGLGTALLDAALAAARDDGALACDLEIAAGHERVASLYARAGFAALPRARWARPLR